MNDQLTTDTTSGRTAEPFPSPAGIDEVRTQRRRLGHSLADVEVAIAGPITESPDTWWQGVRPSILGLQDAFEDHVEATQGDGALHDEILFHAPRLAHEIDRLRADHEAIREQIAEFVHEVEEHRPLTEVRARRTRYAAMGLLARIARHRQRGADVVFEAFMVDVGGSG